MKHTRKFTSISDAKSVTLYSPAVVLVKLSESQKRVLIKKIGSLGTALKITGRTLSDLAIVQNS